MCWVRSACSSAGASPSPQVTSAPAWYWLATIAALLFELAGAYLFANSLTLDPASLHAQAPSGTLEKLYVRGDGTVLHARSSVSARFDDSGQLESVTAFIVNESGQVSALQKAEQAEDRLKDALSI